MVLKLHLNHRLANIKRIWVFHTKSIKNRKKKERDGTYLTIKLQDVMNFEIWNRT